MGRMQQLGGVGILALNSKQNVESRDASDVWSTVGVSENIIEASWLALVDSVEYKLYKDEGGLGAAMSNGSNALAVRSHQSS